VDDDEAQGLWHGDDQQGPKARIHPSLGQRPRKSLQGEEWVI